MKNPFNTLSSLWALILSALMASCSGQVIQEEANPALILETELPPLLTGADQTERYLHLLENKRVGIVVNQTSRIGETHLLDTLISRGVEVKKVFTPEHGFRGEASAGETVGNETDQRTGIPLISLYGKNKKPSEVDLQGLDLILFDIQDVGVRFYTYISTLHYVMEACAENELDLIVLDRPNPNGFYVDGPVLEKEFSSFVGLDPIPVVHGLTVGEYALMCNGERWLKGGVSCTLTVIPCSGYDHSMTYTLPMKPSPNLSSPESILLYPSLCFFEPTRVSIGRGTDKPFTLAGYPGNTRGDYHFTPHDREGAKDPKHEGKECVGYDLSEFGTMEYIRTHQLQLDWLLEFYANYPDKESFFTSGDFFNKLAGNATLRQQIESGLSGEEIRQSWQPLLNEYKLKRKNYLLYPDFE